MEGATNRILSNRSRIPPCPGIKSELFFTLASLFRSDSARSPACPIVPTINPQDARCNTDSSGTSNMPIPTNEIIAKMSPPIAPSTVFLGLTRSYSFFLPIDFPTKKAAESHSQMEENITNMKKPHFLFDNDSNCNNKS